MADSTITVGQAVRGRLATLAAQRGTTIRDLVDKLASEAFDEPTQPRLTRQELDARHAAVTAHIAEHLVPGFDSADVAAGE